MDIGLGQSIVLLVLTLVFVLIARRQMWRFKLPPNAAWLFAMPSALLIVLSNLVASVNVGLEAK